MQFFLKIKDYFITPEQRRVIVAGAVVAMLGTAGFLALWYLGVIFPPFPPQSGPVIVAVEKGTHARAIADKLVAKNLIRSPNVFLGYVKLVSREGLLRSGNFVFHGPLSIPAVLAAMKTGVGEKSIFIPEGWAVADIAAYLEEQGFFSKEEFTAAALPYEGYLFPDTYRVFEDASSEDIIALMRSNFEKKTAEIRRGSYEVELRLPASPKLQRGELGGQARKYSFEDMVIMASLLEREAPSLGDRKLVAGILWKRIEAKMPLQVDASLTYVTGRASRWLTTDDLALDSAYNTYRRLGLPAGPIANPGLKSLEAALGPTPSPYWYYLSDREGLLHYSATFEEHREKKFKYVR